jgi:DNA repair protein RadC
MTENTFWRDLTSGKFAQMVRDEARGEQLNNSREVYNVMKPLFAENDDVETFFCLFLNGRNRIISIEKMFAGSISSAAIYPREIVKRVIALKACAVVMAHNHPSGCPNPSNDDRLITRKILIALASIDVQLLDHIVVGDSYYSMADSGWIKSIQEEFKGLLCNQR